MAQACGEARRPHPRLDLHNGGRIADLARVPIPSALVLEIERRNVPFSRGGDEPKTLRSYALALSFDLFAVGGWDHDHGVIELRHVSSSRYDDMTTQMGLGRR
jgi:hypothetical protein